MHELAGKLAIVPYLFRRPREEQESVRFDGIKEMFEYHYEKNEYYHNLCKASGISPVDIQGIDDLTKIPLIPLRFFKAPDPDARYLLSIPIEESVVEIKSSGTGGLPSVARRDFDTWTNVTIFFVSLYSDFLQASGGAALYLTPSPADVPHLGMIKTFTMFNYTLNTCGYGVENMKLDCMKSVNLLNQWDGKFVRYIFGPPFLLNSFCDYLAENNIRIKLDKASKIVTVGGWKHHSGSEITRAELDQKCKEYLGVEKGQIRDMYAMVEGNFAAFECENNIKHIPPTMHLSIRDMDHPTTELNDGQKGVVAFLDPASLSYPGFLLTEDLGVIRKNYKCSCGRTSDVIGEIGRAPTSDLKTCALTLEQFMEAKELHGATEDRLYHNP